VSWRDHLQDTETLVAPWLGGRSLCTFDRKWAIKGRLPHEHGWYRFETVGRKASIREAVELWEAPTDELRGVIRGYLVGDRLVPDNIRVGDPAKLAHTFERVHLLEQGIDRFERVSAGRFYGGGPLVYQEQGMPSEADEAVLQAFLDRTDSVDDIASVAPALEAAFRYETQLRAETEERRRLEQERREREERQRRIREQLGDGAGRRQVAQEDFGEAAKAALAAAGCEYLDHRAARGRQDEMVVRYQLDNQRLECTCHVHTLRIIDSGICLTAHYDDPDFDDGTEGDTWLTLESLPGVVRQAIRENRLVVHRHVGVR